MRTNDNKYRKSFLGQLVTGKFNTSQTSNNTRNHTNIEDNIQTTTNNDDIDVDVAIVRALRHNSYLSSEDEKKETSRGYNARDTFEDLRRIISYSDEISSFVKEAQGGTMSQSISSFKVYVTDDKVEIKSLIIPPININVSEAIAIDDVDSLRGIIDDNRILSAFSFDAQK
ncbi:hypothetical protein [Staphylococcus pettenkoferi]|uniref:hypothetical protein n=1 Tax=Staphylococcus pettenkoferi TaxID=170573 RepID=UPI0025571750|nr:hypothetical protein [Staphylococcus pettenkoferi]MDK7284294.1 hypothetical protein [Staphylococcus pettenkoferi]